MQTQGLVSKAILIAITVMIAASLLAPVNAVAKDKKKQIDINQLAWPPPPQTPRIRFVAQYFGEDVKGVKKQGFLERLAGVEDMTAKSALQKPYGVAMDSKGRAFVSDTMLSAVFVFDFEKKTLEYRGDKPPAALRKPMGVAIDAQDRLYVSDAEAHNITVFDAAGAVLGMFGDAELTRPVGLAVDDALNRLYVADTKARKIAVFDLTTNKFEKWIGRSADEQQVEADQRDKVLLSPTNLAVDPDGLLYVVDSFMNCVVVFDSDGEMVRRLGAIGQGPGHFMRPRGIAIDSDGHIYVTDAMAHVFQILTPDGKGLMPVGGMGLNPGQFRAPGAIAIGKDNRVVVADQGNRRIQVFRYVTEAEAAAAKAGKPVQSSSAK